MSSTKDKSTNSEKLFRERVLNPQFFKQLQNVKIRTRRAFLGSRQGSHISVRRGHGLEFSDFRPYTQGDDYRHIDWGVWGRTDRLYIRRFQEEQDLNVSVLLDASASMGFPKDENKFEMAKGLALALGYVALADGDTVSMSYLGQRNSPKFIGPRALARMKKDIESVEAQKNIDIVKEVRAALARLRSPGKCFFISDFMFPTEIQFQAIDLIRARNFDISLIQVLAPSELRLNPEAYEHVIDAETGTRFELSLNQSSRDEYAKHLARHIQELERYAAKAGIAHILVESTESLPDVILSRCTEAGILQ